MVMATMMLTVVATAAAQDGGGDPTPFDDHGATVLHDCSVMGVPVTGNFVLTPSDNLNANCHQNPDENPPANTGEGAEVTDVDPCRVFWPGEGLPRSGEGDRVETPSGNTNSHCQVQPS